MYVAVLHNVDHDVLEEDPGREARKDVVQVAAALSDALHQAGVIAERLPVERDLLALGAALQRKRPELVINLCESLAADSRGEMAVPCLLDFLGIPYSGSSALSLGLALHKHKAKELLVARGVPTPRFVLVESLGELVTVDLPFPLIVKPSREDASCGIEFDSVVRNRSELGKAVARVLRTFHQPALIEQYIEGREIYVPLLGNHARRALPLSEIHFGPLFQERPRIISYAAKWSFESPEFKDSPSGPCSLPEATEALVVRTAMAAFAALECRDYGRVDVRLTADGTPYVIDINPNCDLHPEAGFAKAAASAGINYGDLALHLVELALERTHGNTPSRRAGPPAAGRVAGKDRDLLASRGGMRARAHRSRVKAGQR